jgi:thioredoxin
MTKQSAVSVTQVDEISLRSMLDAADGTVVVDFSADWCAPCRAIAPELEQLARSEAVRVVKVDVDEASDLAQELGVRGIPTVVRFDAGLETARSVGLASAGELARRLSFETS